MLAPVEGLGTKFDAAKWTFGRMMNQSNRRNYGNSLSAYSQYQGIV